MTEELSDHRRLLRFNFEWLASSSSSLGSTEPIMSDCIVRLPIHFDDFPLYKENMPFPEWADDARRVIRRHDLTAFGLHDCYAQHWLPEYEGFLDEIATLGALKTMDEVAATMTLANAL